MSSTAAVIEREGAPPQFAEAAAHLAAAGIYGVVWLDRDLNVERTFGSLVSFVAAGIPVTESLIALYGLEQEILQLRGRPERLLELPAVAVPLADGPAKKLNFTFFWHLPTDKPVLLAYRANSQTELELELSRQIRARLMAESEASSKSRELARANADLESFAAIVSHDLKAPLRHMRQLADQLITEKAVAGNEGIVARLTQIQSLSRRMSHMLTELLDYASLGRKDMGLADVNTGALVASIIRALPKTGITVEVGGDWPKVRTLAAPLDLILRNLIANALQHHDRSEGKVVVSCADEPDDLVFRVCDDGPGIAPEHHAAVFLPFRTLAPQLPSSGTGIGLAMVKKTAETAGGAITITSDPRKARGTTLIVKWPKIIRGQS